MTGGSYDLPPVKQFYRTAHDLDAEFDEDYWYGDDN